MVHILPTYSKKAMLYSSKAVAGTVMRLIENPDLLKKAKEEHAKKTGGNYVSLMPKEVMPPV